MTGTLVSTTDTIGKDENKTGCQIAVSPGFALTSLDRNPISEYEMAAAITAVCAYMDLEDAKPETTEYLSNWGRAGLISTRKRIQEYEPLIFKNKNLWRSLILFLVLNLLVSSKAQAVEIEKDSIRVSLAQGLFVAQIGSVDGMNVLDAGTQELCAQLKPQSQWSVNIANNALNIQPSRFADLNRIVTGQELSVTPVLSLSPPRLPSNINLYAHIPWGKTKSHVAFSRKFDAALADQGLLFVPTKDNDAIFTFAGRPYRGSLWLRVKDGKFSAINIVKLEDYLLSVLPSEMPSAWPMEALKAQSIAARSYALANLNKHGKDGYDLGSGTEDQVYRGVLQEKERTNTAVIETTGLVMTHNEKIVPAFYHSSSAGYTESHPASPKLTYLKTINDYGHDSPHSNWRLSFSPGQLQSSLGPNVGRLLGVVAIERSASQRVKTLLLVGDATSSLVSGDAVRKALKLPSTNFNVICDKQSLNYVFCGQGFGHGMGMSQWGARSLAESGWGAGDILNHFYQDVKVTNALESDQTKNSVL